ncbi:SETMAR [Cordylochernes scorpioides]|uniref:SETMAR n=1 Tax=Cordylochernes scorpioides TaxID=51811 RepID=A0ABY6KKA3_9ARAC|nr:SETMAR [Cordylochernes scorpioides]
MFRVDFSELDTFDSSSIDSEYMELYSFDGNNDMLKKPQHHLCTYQPDQKLVEVVRTGEQSYGRGQCHVHHDLPHQVLEQLVAEVFWGQQEVQEDLSQVLEFSMGLAVEVQVMCKVVDQSTSEVGHPIHFLHPAYNSIVASVCIVQRGYPLAGQDDHHLLNSRAHQHQKLLLSGDLEVPGLDEVSECQVDDLGHTNAAFCFNLKKSAADGHRLLCEAYGIHALSIKSCEYWFRHFKSGDFDTRDKERGGRPIKFEDALSWRLYWTKIQAKLKRSSLKPWE